MFFLANKNIKYYFIADIISNFGSGMCFVGLNWFLLQKTGMSEKVGLLMTINIISSLFILPFAGGITDRFDRKLVIIYSNFARAFSLLLVIILLFTTKFSLYYLYFLAASNGICRNLYLPASRAFIQEITSRQEFLKANSFLEISLQTGMFIAGAMAGITYKLFSMQVLLIAIMLTFIVSNFFLYLIKYQKTFSTALNEDFMHKIINGYKYLLGRPIVLIFGIILFIPFVVAISLNVVTPAYVSNYLGNDSVVFGIMDMSYGIGAFLAGFIVMCLSSKYKTNNLFIAFFIVSVASLLMMSINKFVVIAYIAMLFSGIPNSAIRIMLNASLMKFVPKSYMGRTMSFLTFIATILQIIFVYSVGVVVDKSGTPYGYVCIAMIMIVAFLGYLYFSPKFNLLLTKAEETV